jgi:hypothetical protein
MYEKWKANNLQQRWPKVKHRHSIQPKCINSEQPVYVISEKVFIQSLGCYERNQFARLLRQYFGESKANELLQRFYIGTSSRWPGACVFWYIDEHGRKRGGQIKLFADDWHTVKYTDREGKKRVKVDWVHSALKYRLERDGKSLPDWLLDYIDNGERSPCLFGLPQLLAAPINQPVAIVEAPKTAVLCTHHFPQFVWLAVGALSYLNAERLAPLYNRHVVLFPDLSENSRAYAQWSNTANELRKKGFSVTISDYLEKRATDEHRAKGLDLADYIFQSSDIYPDERLDSNQPPNTYIKQGVPFEAFTNAKDFRAFQVSPDSPFRNLGLASLTPEQCKLLIDKT